MKKNKLLKYALSLLEIGFYIIDKDKTDELIDEISLDKKEKDIFIEYAHKYNTLMKNKEGLKEFKKLNEKTLRELLN